MIDEVVTQRLTLRPIARSDADLLLDLDSDTEVMQFLTGRPSERDEVEAQVEASLGARWLVFDQAGSFLGWVGADPEASGDAYDIGWRFRRAAWGNGYATEAAAALVDELFRAGAQRVFAQTMAVNKRSRAVMDRLGLRYARTFHLELDDPLPGTDQGEVEYELTRDQWQAARRSV